MKDIIVLSRGKFYSFRTSEFGEAHCTITGARFKNIHDLLGRFGTPLFGCASEEKGFAGMVCVYVPGIGFPCLPAGQFPTRFRDMTRESDAALHALGPETVEVARKQVLDPSVYVGHATDLVSTVSASTPSHLSDGDDATLV